jgi:ribulose-5-phosphate 4-epimerase/fuculose-1-phosphate aldolase
MERGMGHWEQRVELAAGLRWAARLGMQESIDNHFTLGVRDEREARPGDVFLVNPWGLHWSEITASSLLLCNAAGDVLEGDGEVESTAFHIHSPLHVAAPDQPAVFHTHLADITAIAVLDAGRLVFCQQNACMFWENIAYDDDYHGLALDRAEGERIASLARGVSALVLGGHGVVTLGSTVAEAFGYMYYLDRAAQVQVRAQSTGLPLRELSHELCSRVGGQMKTEFPKSADAYFAYAVRTLAREEPAYAT